MGIGPCEGAHLCVRPSSGSADMVCGRPHGAAPTFSGEVWEVKGCDLRAVPPEVRGGADGDGGAGGLPDA